MNKLEFKKLFADKIVILDGATGTELTRRGMPKGVCPEQWVLQNRSIVESLHKEYIAAGCDIVYTATFGGNSLKLHDFGLQEEVYAINKEIAEIAKQAVAGNGLVFGNISPTGRFIEPFGDVLFEDAVAVFKEQIQALVAGGVDGLVIETMMDLQEARAALIAAKETVDLPVMVSMTYNKDGRTLNGNDPISCLITLQELGADAVGLNCSTGPEDILEIVKLLKPYATIPLLAKPNAGMPGLKDGKTVFDMQAEAFAAFAPEFAAAGINIFGGCCGTTPEYIQAVTAKLDGVRPVIPVEKNYSAISSSRMPVFFGAEHGFKVVGERINPTGKKALQAELREGKTSIVKQFALEQKIKGAHVLDVNMGLSGIDEKEMMLKAIRLLSKTSDLPLCIDSTRPEVIEAALRLYPGRAIVNSISGETERIEKTLPIAAKYGAMFILLPLTDSGIPENFADRQQVTQDVISAAAKYGYTNYDISVDGLVMTISSDQKAADVTLQLIEWCNKEHGLNTVCGLSNVSFGLPERKWINAAFLGMAISRGLSMAIANPGSMELMEFVKSSDLIRGIDG